MSRSAVGHRRWPRLRPRALAVGVLVALLVAVEVVPLLWLLSSSLKAPAEFSANPVFALPEGLYLKNYVDALTGGNVGRYMLNSAIVVFPSIIAILALGVLSAFGLEVMRWRGRNGIMLSFAAGILVPLQMVLLPLFTVYFALGLLNTHWSLIITYVAFGLPLTVFLLAGYFKAVPREMIEAAVVDGANIYQAFVFVALPMVRNALLTVALVQFFFLWNDLLLSLTFISDDDLRTIQTGLLRFTDQYGSRQWGPTFASISLAVFPTLVIYLLLNQRIIRGLTAGSVKG
jgi:raffinose/stachyose/melibiose transport system permease protein